VIDTRDRRGDLEVVGRRGAANVSRQDCASH
jgi:hypothetical protein